MNTMHSFMPDICHELEQFMGSIESETLQFSYKAALQRDENEEFPEQPCQELEKWGFHQYYVPAEFGGKLHSFIVLFWLIRLLARRDLTIAIAHGKTYLGASPIYVGGSWDQKNKISNMILRGKIVSLGLTEKNHGADLVANELSADKMENNYRINGEKWLINNATRGDSISLFAKTANKLVPSRNYSLFFINKFELNNTEYSYLPKIKTHGIRGADISGIRFENAEVNSSALIGHEGSGLEITLKALQISRTLCSSLSLGVADTVLRNTLQFIHSRNLYNFNIITTPYVKQILIKSYLTILICEAVTFSVIRCIHVSPGVLSVYSSISKYWIPTCIESILESLGGLLGARSYLREYFSTGIYQKCLRDNSIVGLFDGSSVINLQTISNQINFIAKKFENENFEIPSETVWKRLFALNEPFEQFDPSQLRLSNHGYDPIGNSFKFLLKKLGSLHLRSEIRSTLTDLLNLIIDKQRHLFTAINQYDFYHEKLDNRKEALLHQYSTLFAAGCCLNIWFYNRLVFNQITDEWLISSLIFLLHKEIPAIHLDRSFDSIYKNMTNQYFQNELFSLINFKLS